jgi:hypothetical protein
MKPQHLPHFAGGEIAILGVEGHPSPVDRRFDLDRFANPLAKVSEKEEGGDGEAYDVEAVTIGVGNDSGHILQLDGLGAPDDKGFPERFLFDGGHHHGSAQILHMD